MKWFAATLALLAISTAGWAGSYFGSDASNSELHPDCSTADIEIVWTDQVVGNALGECNAFIEPIDDTSTSVHYRLIPFVDQDRILVKINSTVRWDVAFADGFETGDTARWE